MSSIQSFAAVEVNSQVVHAQVRATGARAPKLTLHGRLPSGVAIVGGITKVKGRRGRFVARLVAIPGHDELQLRRLKKKKLLIKDQILQLQIQLVPDIPA